MKLRKKIMHQETSIEFIKFFAEIYNGAISMTKKTRLIPFDYDLYKAGAKAVFDESPIVRKILEIYDKTAGIKKYLVVFESCCGIEHVYSDDEQLLIVRELEEKTFYVNVYSSYQQCFDTALKADLNAYDRIGMLKVIYTDEDLIK
jgi:hypothetical protein